MNNKFEKKYMINTYDVDSNLRCKFSSLVNYLWDVVISQSEHLGETSDGLISQHSLWVLLKYDISIHEYPKLKETITVDTGVLGIKKFYGYRNYTIKNSNGDIIANATSTAILIDEKKRRPAKISEEQSKIYGIEGELSNPPVLDDIALLEREDFSGSYPVRFSDIDSNNHVNNVKYMEMSLDTLPRSILNEYNLSNIKVLFKKESLDGDTLKVSTQLVDRENPKSIHIIENNEGKLLVKLEFQWTKR